MSYIPSASYEPGFPIEWEGLDYTSAYDATPRIYAVSSGNGNDGVSHMWPNYYVRTADPWLLAKAAIINQMNPDYYVWAFDNAEIDGEAEYTISATLYDPPDDGERDHSNCDDGDDCEGCDECDPGSWSEHNGAWMIVEVFQVDNVREGYFWYNGLSDGFDEKVLAIAFAE